MNKSRRLSPSPDRRIWEVFDFLSVHFIYFDPKLVAGTGFEPVVSWL